MKNNFKKNRFAIFGFTLIELLAVIVILAVIALIATPIVLNMINDARKGAAKDSAYGYIKAIEHTNSMSMIESSKYSKIEDGTDIEVTSTLSKINLKGTKPASGTLTIKNGRVKEADLCIDGFNVIYSGEKATVTNSKKCKKTNSSSEFVYVCDQTIYNNGAITKEKYNELCKNYIYENEYTYTKNDDNTITLTGFKEGVTPTIKNGVWALPTQIDGYSISSINKEAFMGNSLGNVLIISPTIKTIGDSSFNGNTLKYLAIPNSVTTLGNGVFAGNDFSSIKLPDSITSVGFSLFSNNSNLTYLDIGGGFAPSQGTFGGSENTIKTLIIGSNELDTELKLNSSSFSNYNALEKLTLKKNVVSLAGGVFQNNSKLSEVTIEGNIETISSFAFFDDKSLKTITIPNTVKTIESYAFQSSALENIVIPDSVTKIEYGAFMDCPIKSIKIGSNVQSIDTNAFNTIYQPEGYTIENIEIPNSVTTLGSRAFNGLTVKNLKIGDGVSVSSGSFEKLSVENLTIGSNDTSKNQTIKERAFWSGYANIKNLTINPSVKGIESNAFRETRLQNLTLKEGIKTIGGSAFYNNLLEEVTIPSTATEIGTMSFQNNKISSLTLKEGIKTIGQSAFYNNKIKNLTIPNSISTIEGIAFGNNKLETINVGSGLTTKSSPLFPSNSNLKTINDNSGLIECSDASGSTPTINNLKTNTQTVCSEE